MLAKTKTAAFRIVGGWNNGRTFLVCVGTDIDACMESLKFSVSDIGDKSNRVIGYRLNDLPYIDECVLQEWKPSLETNRIGNWVTLASVIHRFQNAVTDNDAAAAMRRSV